MGVTKCQNLYNKYMDEKQIKKNIADTLRVLRAKKRLTQDELAELSGVSQKYIAAIEHEKSNPSSVILVKIASALEVTVNDLIY